MLHVAARAGPLARHNCQQAQTATSGHAASENRSQTSSSNRASPASAWTRKSLTVQLLQQLGSRNGSRTAASPTLTAAVTA
jgi:hypothetical protein